MSTKIETFNPPEAFEIFKPFNGIVKLSEFDQKRGQTRMQHALIVQHSGYWPEVENPPNLT
jgi:hypothetical protein